MQETKHEATEVASLVKISPKCICAPKVMATNKLLQPMLFHMKLMLSPLGKNFNVFLIFPEKGFDISCKLSPLETICMKCQNLFSGKKEKISSMFCLLNSSRVVKVDVFCPGRRNLGLKWNNKLLFPRKL